jgi:hypothetical protein
MREKINKWIYLFFSIYLSYKIDRKTIQTNQTPQTHTKSMSYLWMECPVEQSKNLNQQPTTSKA